MNGQIERVGVGTCDVRVGPMLYRNAQIARPLSITELAVGDEVLVEVVGSTAHVTNAIGHNRLLNDRRGLDETPPPVPSNVRIANYDYGPLLQWSMAGWTPEQAADLSYFEVDGQLPGSPVDAWGYKGYPVTEGKALQHRPLVGEPVRVRVRSVDREGNASAWVVGGVMHDTIAPPAPTGLEAEGLTISVRLTWTGPTTSSCPDLAGFEVYMADTDTGGGAVLVETLGLSYSATVELLPGVVKYFNLKALDYSGNLSPYGATWVSATPVVGPGHQLLLNSDLESTGEWDPQPEFWTDGQGTPNAPEIPWRSCGFQVGNANELEPDFYVSPDTVRWGDFGYNGGKGTQWILPAKIMLDNIAYAGVLGQPGETIIDGLTFEGESDYLRPWTVGEWYGASIYIKTDAPEADWNFNWTLGDAFQFGVPDNKVSFLVTPATHWDGTFPVGAAGGDSASVVFERLDNGWVRIGRIRQLQEEDTWDLWAAPGQGRLRVYVGFSLIIINRTSYTLTVQADRPLLVKGRQLPEWHLGTTQPDIVGGRYKAALSVDAGRLKGQNIHIGYDGRLHSDILPSDDATARNLGSEIDPWGSVYAEYLYADNLVVQGNAVDHGTLAGLADDDHTQYLNQARHDVQARHALGTVVPHDDHGALGGLADDDHSQYLHLTQARTVAAQHTFSPGTARPPFALGVNAQGQTVTGLKADQLNKSVDVSGLGLSGGGALGQNRTITLTSSSNPGAAASILASDENGVLTLVDLTLAGKLSTGSVGSSLIPALTDTYDLGSSTKLWHKGYLSELDTLLFAENTILLIGGWFYVVKHQGAAGVDISAAATQLDLNADASVMKANDFIVFRLANQVEYMQLVGYSAITGLWTVVRNRDGSGANTWPAGSVYACLGYNGDGRIELNANSTPRISLLRQGTAWNTQTELIRIGDLNGGWGYSAEKWGVALGLYATGKPNVLLDQDGVLKFRTYTTNRLVLDGSGVLTINDSDGAAVFTFNASAGAEFTKPLTLGLNGGIYQGTGTFATPTTGLKLWNDGGVGRIAGYNAGVLQAGFGTDGKLTAGGGAVTLDANGITIDSDSNLLLFINSSYAAGKGYVFGGGGASLAAAVVGMQALNTNNTQTAVIRLYSYAAGANVIDMALDNIIGGDLHLAFADDLTKVGSGSASGLGFVIDDTTAVKWSVRQNGSVWDQFLSGSLTFNGTLKSGKNSTTYDVYGYYPLESIVKGWVGVTNRADQVINLQAAPWSLPAGIKAVSVMLGYNAANAGNYGRLMRDSGDDSAVVARITVGGLDGNASGIVNCDANGDIYFETNNTTNTVYLYINGYFI